MKSVGCVILIPGEKIHSNLTIMTERNFTKELSYYTYRDMVYGEDIESIDYPALIGIITELCDRIEQLEKDNELLKSYAWEQ